MRKLILAVTILALTAVTAFTAGGALVGSIAANVLIHWRDT